MATIFTSSHDLSFAMVFSGRIMRTSFVEMALARYSILHRVLSSMFFPSLHSLTPGPFILDPVFTHAYCIISFSGRGLRGNTPLEGRRTWEQTISFFWKCWSGLTRRGRSL